MEELGARGPHLVLDRDFPDPFVLGDPAGFFAYATGKGGRNVQMSHSANLASWAAPEEVLPNFKLPAWVDQDRPEVWAPEVMRIGGRYVLYFNARHQTLTRTEFDGEAAVVRKRQCVGVAVSDSPRGEFVGLPDPLVCSEFAAGVIDASPFRDGDMLYLYYKGQQLLRPRFSDLRTGVESRWARARWTSAQYRRQQ